jgi:hypothetical protein
LFIRKELESLSAEYLLLKSGLELGKSLDAGLDRARVPGNRDDGAAAIRMSGDFRLLLNSGREDCPADQAGPRVEDGQPDVFFE